MQRAPATTLVVVAIALPIFIVAVAWHASSVARAATPRLAKKSYMAGAIIGFFVITGIAGEFLAGLRNEYVGEAFRIPAASMLPTLQIGDHFYSDARAYADDGPSRGDIIIFTVARDGSAIYPADRRPDLPTENFVKRVVGVPGDEIQLHGATLVVNGFAVTGPPLDDRYEAPNGRSLIPRPEELDSHHYRVLDDPNLEPDVVSLTVEPGRYFVSGDNRLHSNDSRYWGTISRNDVIGEVTKIYWSWNFNGSPALLLNPLEWVRLLQSETRWERVGLAPS
jgi:signal peptidase I